MPPTNKFSGETFYDFAAQAQQVDKEILRVNYAPYMAARGIITELMKSGEIDS